jgi:hypothetical protein
VKSTIAAKIFGLAIDAPSELFLKRVAGFRENPSAADWDGSSQMQTK